MLTTLKLERFKNFKEAELSLGPFTVLIGSNASGKSNVRDAFRFLHGIARGYNLAEIMGEKYGEGGFLQWQGIRGGVQEATYLQADTFSIEVALEIPKDFLFPGDPFRVNYTIQINAGLKNNRPKVVSETLCLNGSKFFEALPSKKDDFEENIIVRILENGQVKSQTELDNKQSVLTQLADVKIVLQKKELKLRVTTVAAQVQRILKSMRFLDLVPDALRRPSFPGQTILGDRGENLSSVLQALCEDAPQKQALIEWVRELTPMDVTDFEFIPDQTGRVLVNFVEENGSKISAYSASDGTLRFLGMIAALLGPEPARLYFIEELDNGLHPARLYLLLQLIEQQTAKGATQVIATTHSPQLLRFLSPASLEHASLIYRLPETSEGRIKRILDIPDAQRLIEDQDVARLHESGWFEDALSFLAEDEPEAVG